MNELTKLTSSTAHLLPRPCPTRYVPCKTKVYDHSGWRTSCVALFASVIMTEEKGQQIVMRVEKKKGPNRELNPGPRASYL